MTLRWHNSSHRHLPDPPECTIRPHYHDEVHESWKCRRVAAPVGDSLFPARIASIAAAQVKIQTLDISCAMTGEFRWDELPDWAQLDLRQLKVFRFGPDVRSIGECLESVEVRDAASNRAASAITAIVKNCSTSLQVFEYKNTCPMHWPPEEVVKLPQLRAIHLGSDDLQPQNMAAWMAEMPSLELLQLSGTRLRVRNRHWLEVFDAVRNHGRGMRCNFHPILASGDSHVVINHHTVNDLKEVLGMTEHENPWMDIYRSLSLYLSGQVRVQ